MSVKINDIASKYIKTLEPTLLGGVKRTSAEQTIKNVVQDFSPRLDNALNQVDEFKRENVGLNILNKKLVAELDEVQKGGEELTVLVEKLIYKYEKLRANNKTLKAQVQGFKSKINDLTSFKKIKTNEDGSEVFAKANLNGARMTKTVKDGDVVEISVDLLDGSNRTTKYKNNKPFKTTTNINGGKEIYYEKPAVIEECLPVGNPKVIKEFSNEITERQIFSDGSYVDTTKLKSTDEIIERYTYNGKTSYWIEKYTKDPDTGIEKVITREETSIPGLKLETCITKLDDEILDEISNKDIVTAMLGNMG